MAKCQTRSKSLVADHPVRSSTKIQYLDDEEIDAFLDDLDHNQDGYINYEEVERKLDQEHAELVPKPGPITTSSTAKMIVSAIPFCGA